jgi:hypothetical protein
MRRSRQWSSWVVLLCAGLAPATDPTSFAAENPPPEQRPAAAPKKVVPAAPAGRGAGVGRRAIAVDANDQNVRNFAAQFRPQFQQLLYVELAVLRRVCNVEPKPFTELARASQAHLHVLAQEYAAAQYKAMRQGSRRDSDVIDPRSQTYSLLAPLVEAKLGPEQARRYRQECDLRTESRKRATVLNLTAALDERLVLTAQQRETLVRSLSAHYKNQWNQWLQMCVYNPQYLPPIPDDVVVPLLNEKQKSVWRQTARSGNVFFGFQNFMIDNGILRQAPEIQEIARLVEGVQDD